MSNDNQLVRDILALKVHDKLRGEVSIVLVHEILHYLSSEGLLGDIDEAS